MKRPGLTAQVLIALGVGLLAGAAIAASGNPSLAAIPGYLEPIGTMWVNALRMVVIPLVVSAIVVGVSSVGDSRTLGRIGRRATVICISILAIAATFAVLVGPLVLSFLEVSPATAEAMRANAAASSEAAVRQAQTVTGFRGFLIDLVPVNPVKAMADGAMLPVIVFTLLFALGVARLGDQSRGSVVAVAKGFLAATLTMVGWFLAIAPIGVFALTLPLAGRLGLAAAGAAVYYVVAVSVMLSAFMALLYLAAWLIGRHSLRAFARACAPAQAVAASARASMATLPAMLQGAEALGLPIAVRSFFLPLAAASFRTGSAIAIPVGVLFLARLHGVPMGGAQLVTIALMAIVTTFSVPSIPGGTIIVMVPILMAANLPVSAVGLLLGVDTIPDMFRTATHVTADMTAASILSRGEAQSEDQGRVPSSARTPGITSRP
jgi:proton glutamate symport protein